MITASRSPEMLYPETRPMVRYGALVTVEFQFNLIEKIAVAS